MINLFSLLIFVLFIVGTIISYFNSSKYKYTMKKANSYHEFRGYTNDQNGCYANSSIQCLFNVPQVKHLILNSHASILRDSLLQYKTANRNQELSLIKLRSKYYKNEQAFRQQDAAEFIGKLFDDKETSYLGNLFQYNETNYIKCTKCNYNNIQTHKYTMKDLIIPEREPNHLYEIQELLDYNLYEKFQDLPNVTCDYCQSIKQKQTIFSNFNLGVIFFLTLFDSKNGKKMNNIKFNLNSINQNNITLDKNIYEFSSAILHHGSSIQNGHYTSILKKNTKYYYADDERVQQFRWSESFQDIYVLMYTRKK